MSIIVEADAISNQVYLQIKRMIENGDLAPGERIRKQDIADLLQVSQTPINNALNRLVGEQILEMERRKGCVVRELSREELIELFGLRAGVESVAARLACELVSDDDIQRLELLFSSFEVPVPSSREQEYIHADNEFHTMLVELSGNSMLRSSYERYGVILRSNLQGLIRPPDETLQEHRAIIAALRDRDALRVQHEVSSHILESRVRLLKNSNRQNL